MARELIYKDEARGAVLKADPSVAWCIDQVKPANAVEVVHGWWIYHECISSYDGAKSGWSCSKCNAFVNEEIFDMDEFHKDFCGRCGARMKGIRLV